MKEILHNLALIDLNKVCVRQGIDISDSYLYKTPRKYTYTLFKNVKGGVNKPLASVTFYNSSIPTHLFYTTQ